MGMKIKLTLTDDDGRSYDGIAELKAITSPQSPGQKQKKTTAAAESQVKGLPEHILALREKSYFREPRTSSEVHSTLLEAYPCLPNRVQVALLRLHKQRELRKAVKKTGGQEYAAYVW
jgi:hypothetical protein